MRFRRFIVLFGLIALLVVSCGSGPTTPPPAPTAGPQTQPPAPTAAPPTVPPATATNVPPAGLDAAALKSGTYTLLESGKTVTLADGTFTQDTAGDLINATLLDQMAFADFNADGAGDAAVLLAENDGGSGVFVSLIVMLNQGGQAVQSDAVLIDDRAQINSLSVQNGRIVVEAITHSINDPMCCPTMTTHQEYTWANGKLRLARYTSQLPTGALRAIQIDSPASGTAASGSVTVKGTVASSPFENTLGYRISDVAGNKLAEGPVMVNSDGAGGPGTFEAVIDLSSIPAGTPIVLALVDLSAADGSTIALDSVELTIQ